MALRAADMRLHVSIDHWCFIHNGAVTCLELQGGECGATVTHNSPLLDVDDNVPLLGENDSQAFGNVEFLDSVVAQPNKVDVAAGAVTNGLKVPWP